MLSQVAWLLLFAVVGFSMDIKELTEKVERISSSPMVVMSLVFDSDKSKNIGNMQLETSTRMCSNP